MSIFSTRPEPVAPGPGQESVWDYPRPPRLEPVAARLLVVLAGETIADTKHGYRVLETSHPPNYYFPLDDVLTSALERSAGRSFCEFKGRAHYYTVRAGSRRGGGGFADRRRKAGACDGDNVRVEPDAAWGYDGDHQGAYALLAGHVAFYAGRMDACFVDGERAAPQPGGYYGGWITSKVVGPFKGGPGTRGW